MSRFEHIKEQLAELNGDAYLFDGFEEGMVGYTQQYGRAPVACYDYDACIKILVERDDMSEEEAIEFFEFNTVGCGGLGANTPAILRQVKS
jgi:hypothetical protein